MKFLDITTLYKLNIDNLLPNLNFLPTLEILYHREMFLFDEIMFFNNCLKIEWYACHDIRIIVIIHSIYSVSGAR